jgi:hypothetical protein
MSTADIGPDIPGIDNNNQLIALAGLICMLTPTLVSIG